MQKGLTDTEIDIFLQIVLNPEFGFQSNGARKWDKDLLVFLKNPERTSLVNEFNKISNEINELSQEIKIRRVFDESEANFIIFFSDMDSYAKFEPTASEYLYDNLGFFWVRANERFIVESGSMYVDVDRTDEIECQKHLLREELTQSLGMMNDHNGPKNSIFHRGWNCTTKYSEMDKRIISVFLNNEIKAGMSHSKLQEYLSK
nr:DUF2927 domain-containing protein [Allomuricauda sp.]